MSKRKVGPARFEGKTDTRVTNFTGLEPLAVEMLKELATTYGPAVATAIAQGLKGEQSLFVQVKASWKEEDRYFIALTFKNVTAHGVYLEKLSIREPQGVSVVLRKFEAFGSNYGFDKHSAPPEIVLPLLVGAGLDNQQAVVMEITDNKRGDLQTRFEMEVEHVYTQLDLPVDYTRSSSLKVAVRQKGPRFVAA